MCASISRTASDELKRIIACWSEQHWTSLDDEKRQQLKSFFDRCYTLAPSENPRKVASTVLLEVFPEGTATHPNPNQDLFKIRRTAIMEVLFGSVLAPKPKNKKAGGGAAGGGAGGGAASKP
jgi:hypothetical protein